MRQNAKASDLFCSNETRTLLITMERRADGNGRHIYTASAAMSEAIFLLNRRIKNITQLTWSAT